MEPRRTKHPRPHLPTRKATSTGGVVAAENTASERDVLATLPERATFITNPAGLQTHAVIPFNDYVYLLALQAARDALPLLSDPDYKWFTLEEVMTEFAAPKIAATREKKGLTQKQLGAKLGMPQSQVSRMEKNPASVTYRTLQRVAKALGVKINDMLA